MTNLKPLAIRDSSSNHSQIPFTVVMTTYKNDHPVFLKESVNSIQNQTYPPNEIILVVDGPVSACLSNLIDNFEKQGVNVIKLPKNFGQGYARNIGINASKYEIIALMDADDIAALNRFEMQIRYFTNKNISVVGGIIEEFNLTPGDLNLIRVVPLSHEKIIAYAKYRQPVNNVTIAFRKSSYLLVGGYKKIRYVEDYDLIYRMLHTGARFMNIDSTFVYVRTGNNQIARRIGIKYLSEELKLLLRMRLDNFTNTFQFITCAIIRIFFRIMPLRILDVVYKKLLRSQLIFFNKKDNTL